MIYKNTITAHIQELIDHLELIKKYSLTKKELLLKKNSSIELLNITKKEEVTYLSFCKMLKTIKDFISLTEFNSFIDFINNCNDIEIKSKYNYVLELEKEVRDINDLNFEIVSSCLKINNHYLNLLYPTQDTNLYTLDNNLVNKKLKMLNSVY